MLNIYMLHFTASVGLSFLQFTNMNSMRNLFIAGVSLFLGLSIPEYFREYTTAALHGPSHTKAGWVSPASVHTIASWFCLLIIWIHAACICCSSTIFWTQSSCHRQRWRWLWRCSWTTRLSTKTVQGTGECHGGQSSERSREIAGMKSFTPSLSTSTASSRPHKWMMIKGNTKKCKREKYTDRLKSIGLEEEETLGENPRCRRGRRMCCDRKGKRNGCEWWRSCIVNEQTR